MTWQLVTLILGIAWALVALVWIGARKETAIAAWGRYNKIDTREGR